MPPGLMLTTVVVSMTISEVSAILFGEVGTEEPVCVLEFTSFTLSVLIEATVRSEDPAESEAPRRSCQTEQNV